MVTKKEGRQYRRDAPPPAWQISGYWPDHDCVKTFAQKPLLGRDLSRPAQARAYLEGRGGGASLYV